MPYIKPEGRHQLTLSGLADLTRFLIDLSPEARKGALAYAVMYLARYSYSPNYYGKSTSTDAIRSVLNEMEADLLAYEANKKKENGDV